MAISFQGLMYKQQNLRNIMTALVDAYFEAMASGKEDAWQNAAHAIITLFSSRLIEKRSK